MNFARLMRRISKKNKKEKMAEQKCRILKAKARIMRGALESAEKGERCFTCYYGGGFFVVDYSLVSERDKGDLDFFTSEMVDQLSKELRREGLRVRTDSTLVERRIRVSW